ncbi:3-dehydrosphinganine reductase, partial [Quaeritorhiza haematococci]
MGKSLAIWLARQGAHVTIVSRDRTKLEKALVEIEAARVNKDQKFCYVSADLTSSQNAKHALQDAVEKIGMVPEYVFTCAGLAQLGLFLEQDIGEFDSQMRTNYFTALYTLKEAANLMVENDIRGGKLVITSSLVAFAGFVGYSAYTPAKSALRGLADCLRNEMQMYDIGVHIYFPGNILSPGYENE